MQLRRILLALACVCIVGATARAALPANAEQFIQTNCVDCHDADSKKGGLDLTAATFDLDNDKAFELWVKVHDRVRDHEMPPKNKKQPTPADAKAFLESIAAPMIAADDDRAAREGRAVWRRLNRYEYENAVRDLLDAPWLQIKDMLPEDGESHRFNKDGAALSVSHVQMAGYLDAAEYALHEVAAHQVQSPAMTVTRYYARKQPSFAGKVKFSVFNRSSERATFPIIGFTADNDVSLGSAPMTAGPKHLAQREEEAFGVVASSYEPIELRFDRFTAPMSGRYKLRFNAFSFWSGNVSTKDWWHPDRSKVFKGRTFEPVTIYSDTTPRLLRRLGAFDVTPEPTIHEMDVYLLAGETIRPDAARLFRSRPPNWHNPLAEKDGMPGVAFKWMEVEGPILDGWPSKGHQTLFADLPLKDPVSTGDNAQVVAKDPNADAQKLLSAFMAKAYRRPVPQGEIDRFFAVFTSAQKAGDSFADSMDSAYTAVLCSPDFVTVEERPGKLDDFALATRLSLFLWNSTPDGALRELAVKGQLHEPQILLQQTDRLLADPKSSRFVHAFLDYWLDLRKLNISAPDSTLYPDYYLDDLLLESAEDETPAFFTELLSHNLPARNVVSSNFAMLNERLAKHYGIPGVQGVQIRRVQLPPDSLRGGLMTQAAVLKVTANGTTTSPVVRGVWIMERIVGKPAPPPPPKVPAIDPDIRGASTIRQQLALHRTQATCSACHAKIDPAGFALENFDVMGGYRQFYRAIADDKATPTLGFGHNGQKFTFHDGPPVDPSAQLPDGRSFKDVRELKKLLLSDERLIARNMVNQLVTYSTGAAPRFGDRPQVEAILDRSTKSEFGVRTLIEEIVQSEMFQTK